MLSSVTHSNGKRPHPAVAWDEAAERAVLGAIMLRNEALERAARIGPADFFKGQHREIFSVMLELARRRSAIDPVTLEAELARLERLQAIGGIEFISDLAGDSFTVDNIEHYVAIVAEHATTRRVQLACSEVLHSGLTGEALREAAEMAFGTLVRAKPAAASEAPRIAWTSTRDIFEPLPPTEWVVHGLGLCPGRPSMIAGYGYSGKTIAMQSALLSAAGGLPIWGYFGGGEPMAVGHLDFEQGQHATRKRYQRLLRGLGLALADLEDRLRLSVFPSVYLNSPDAADAIERAADGLRWMLIDALRGATPGEDENDSQMRSYLDMLARISERIGTTFSLVHHAGKPKDAQGPRDARMTLRGSSGIFDACGSVLVLSADINGPRLVQQAKAPAEAEGAAMPDFHLVVEDLEDGAVRVVHQEKQRKVAEDPAAKEERELARVFAMQNLIVAAVRAAQVPPTSREAVCDLVTGEHRIKQVAMSRLLAEGRRMKKTPTGFVCP